MDPASTNRKLKAILINIDGLQASATGLFGASWIPTHSLNILAARGMVFDRHFAVLPDRVHSREVLLSGSHELLFRPELLGARENVTGIREMFRGKGVFCQMISSGHVPLPTLFNQGWDHQMGFASTVKAMEEGKKFIQSDGKAWFLWMDLGGLLPPWQVPQVHLRRYFSSTLEESDPDSDEKEDLETESGEAELEPHEPLKQPRLGKIDPMDDELYLRIKETYAAAISHLDSELAKFLDELDDDVFVIVTADSGQSLGEHGLVGDEQPSVHVERVHVPLILYGPGVPPGLRVGELTSSIDIAPTLAGLVGQNLSHSQGRDLLHTPIQSLKEKHELLLCSRVGQHAVWGLRNQDWSFIRDGLIDSSGSTLTGRLFAQPEDYWEINDLARNHPGEVETFAILMDNLIRDQGKTVSFTPSI
ncbi:MAG: sulfatase-like hydrolase/transferase [Gemmataceae bacterium]